MTPETLFAFGMGLLTGSILMVLRYSKTLAAEKVRTGIAEKKNTTLTHTLSELSSSESKISNELREEHKQRRSAEEKYALIVNDRDKVSAERDRYKELHDAMHPHWQKMMVNRVKKQKQEGKKHG